MQRILTTRTPSPALPRCERRAVLRSFRYVAWQLAVVTAVATWFVTSEIDVTLALYLASFGYSLLVIWVIGRGLESFSLGTLQVLLTTFACSEGVFFGAVAEAVHLTHLLAAVGAASLVFFLMAAYGYFTKRELSGWGVFLFISLVGLLLVWIVVLLLGASAAVFWLSMIGIILFALYTAYDVSEVREASRRAISDDELSRIAIWGAMALYLDLANLIVDFLNVIEFGDVG